MHVNAIFHPVGQGLFSTGEVNEGGQTVRWIYDCGTTSSQRLLDQAIDDVHAGWGGERPQIDLLVLSHFDKDHISGILKLLPKITVKTLLLPHVPLTERLIYSFAHGIPRTSRVFRFLLDPVRYLRSSGQFEIERILLVLPAGAQLRQQDEGGGGDVLGPLAVRVEDPETLGNEVQRDLGLDLGNGIGAEAIRSSAPLISGRDWEFVPYNDASLRPKTPARFARTVRTHRNRLLAAPTQALVDQLKRVYDDEFGDSGFGRNVVSLFLYAGTRRHTRFELSEWYLRSHGDAHRRNFYHCSHLAYGGYVGRGAGFLYTGDGYLDTPARLKRYLRHLGRHRLSGANCLQVMHHGSRKNWHAGVAAALRPAASVFSSNPDHRRFRHPHGDVVRDFLPYQPVQVAHDRTASISVELY